ncbi:MAG TPA: MXAN_5187 C-terminal domain-containing protein [Candidatus Polarisedimenticolaceae bacterium]|nr:MXAN_5187 C-terminal domain-containing protein [Candidatus Polarisedimenticolaceae bacterium]
MTDSLQPPKAGTVFEADMHRLDVGIRQLKVQYDMFFAGALPREPLEQRQQVERIVKRYANNSTLKYAESFRLNSLISRFNSLAELWSKTVRRREEGAAPAAALANPHAPREQLVARCRLSETRDDDPELRRLYQRFVETRRRMNDGNREISYQKFVRGIAGQTERLRNQHGCAEMELRVVVHDHKVLLKVRSGG